MKFGDLGFGEMRLNHKPQLSVGSARKLYMI